MSDTMHEPRWRRLLDGGHTWGALDISPTRYGVTRYRLVVFPPGISADDRRLLRAWRTWPVWGTATFLALEMLLVPTIGSGAALGISAGVFLGAGAVSMAMTGTNRCDVRTLTATRTGRTEDPMFADRFAELDALAHDLALADRKLANGQISTVGHEFLVWRVYDRMATDARTRH
jgi:hypothetical protein